MIRTYDCAVNALIRMYLRHHSNQECGTPTCGELMRLESCCAKCEVRLEACYAKCPNSFLIHYPPPPVPDPLAPQPLAPPHPAPQEGWFGANLPPSQSEADPYASSQLGISAEWEAAASHWEWAAWWKNCSSIIRLYKRGGHMYYVLFSESLKTYLPGSRYCQNPIETELGE